MMSRMDRERIMKDVLTTQDHADWLKFKELARRRGTSRSALIRRYIRWELRRDRRSVA
jgi:hypothetical protein